MPLLRRKQRKECLGKEREEGDLVDNEGNGDALRLALGKRTDLHKHEST